MLDADFLCFFRFDLRRRVQERLARLCAVLCAMEGLVGVDGW
jgi:hypothetical protein